MLAGYLRERASAALGMPVGLDQPLTGLGLDSLSAIELKGAVESALGLSLPLADLLQGISVAGLAEPAARGGRREPLTSAAARALAGGGPAALAGAAGALVPAPAGSRGGRLQHRRGGARPGGWTRRRSRGPSPRLAARHEALRTIFPVVGDEPVQRVLPRARLRTSRSWRHLPPPPGRGGLAAVRAGARAAAAGADLQRRGRGDGPARRPPHRGRLRLAGGDGPGPLGPLPRGGRWSRSRCATPTTSTGRREMLAGPRGERLWSYWRQRLAGRARPRPAGRPPAAAGADLARRRPRGCAPRRRWSAAARRRWAPAGAPRLFMTLLAGFQAQLARYTGQEDFAVGAAVAGRTAARARGAGRLLRQPPRPARRPLRRAGLRAAARRGRGARRWRGWSTATSPSP